jgi:hypothetical protein
MIMDDIIQRIETGMTTEADARRVARIIAENSKIVLFLREVVAWCSDQYFANEAKEILRGWDEARTNE